LTNKSSVIGRLKCDLIQFFDNLVVTYFFGPPCIYSKFRRDKIAWLMMMHDFRIFVECFVFCFYFLRICVWDCFCVGLTLARIPTEEHLMYNVG